MLHFCISIEEDVSVSVRTSIVVASSQHSSLARIKAAMVGTSLAHLLHGWAKA
jgi:flagellar biosynthesis/type III secretory pathway ATPase